MMSLDVAVVTAPEGHVVDEIDELLGRVTEATGHDALSEHKRVALRHTVDRTDASNRDPPLFVGVLARLDSGADRGGPRTPKDLVGYAELVGKTHSGPFAVELVVDPEFASPAVGSTAVGDALLGAALDEVARAGGGTVRLWVARASPADDALAAAHGLRIERNLIQMRCRLPLDTSGTTRPDLPVPTRSFRPGVDEAAWLATNNRAFAGHSEQGRWEMATLLEREKERWFDPSGFLVVGEGGRIAGSCWTKIHADTDPPMGEIYVIGVDPDFHGRGWGRALTLAGLDWLAGAGMSVGMLYVDAANTAAVSLYRSIGFAEDHVDRSYSGRFDPA
jgi:mycothiol synthase